MSRKQRIEDRIRGTLNPVHMDIVDESYMHSVPAGAESHYKVLVVSERFAEEALVDRHRRLNELLKDEFSDGLHALSLHTWTPEEWAERGGIPESPPCRGGSKAV